MASCTSEPKVHPETKSKESDRVKRIAQLLGDTRVFQSCEKWVTRKGLSVACSEHRTKQSLMHAALPNAATKRWSFTSEMAKSSRSAGQIKRYKSSVFINCPFDPDYKPLFHALVFGIQECGLIPRCALEIEDSSEIRISKISRLIGECRFAVHDLSRVELGASGLPRNMPLELAPRATGINGVTEMPCI